VGGAACAQATVGSCLERAHALLVCRGSAVLCRAVLSCASRDHHAHVPQPARPHTQTHPNPAHLSWGAAVREEAAAVDGAQRGDALSAGVELAKAWRVGWGWGVGMGVGVHRRLQL
jgi:hypothetical protein